MGKSKRRNSFYVPSLPPLASGQQQEPQPNNNNATRPPLPPGHFLRNVNLNGNLLDIPDPPSPPRRNPRRQSSPMLRMKLRDVTNKDGDNETTMAAAVAGTKRSRKSLCHVPSPATEEVATLDNDESIQHDTKSPLVDDNANEEQKDQATTPAISSSICFDDDEEVVVSSSKRRKRRESMILPSDMAPLPMEEEETSTDTVELQDDDDDVSVMITSKRTSRRLSIVMPSDIASFQNEVAEQVFRCSEEDLPMKGEGEQNDESMQKVDDKISPIQKRRPTKRQSIVLPSDASLLQDDEETQEYFEQIQSAETNEENATTSASESPLTKREPKQEEISTVPDERAQNTSAMEAERIRTLVRDYCSLPLSDRSMSKQAEEIEQLTGYALVPPSTKRIKAKRKSGADLNWSGSPHDDDSSNQVLVTSTITQDDSAMAKRELLLKLGAMVEIMEQRKVQDAKEMEDSTGCRFQRSRSGKYRYYQISTNRKVSPADYEELYLASVNQSKAVMSKRIQEWLRQSENCSDMSEEEIHEQCVQLSALVESAQQPIPKEFGSEESASPFKASVNTATSDSDMEESPLSEEEENSEDLRKDSSTSPPLIVVNQTDYARALGGNDVEQKEADTSTEPVGDTDASLNFDSQVSPSSSDSNSSAEANGESSSELLLPLPCRDEASDDPEIAALEEQLWSDIDAALERYSRQVIALREARAASEQS